MELSKRLQIIANQVDKGSIVADIGTDHGYIPIYLAKKGIVQYGFAMDINKGPLLRAKNNIKAYKVEDKVETRLSNGVEGLKPGEADTIIIAGMGGMLISEILMQGKSVMKEASKLILSPHLDVDTLRRTLHRLGFRIDHEVMMVEDRKYYNIISAVRGNEIYEKDIDYKYGKLLLDNKSEVLKAYMQHRLKINKAILEKLVKVMSEQSEQRKSMLKQENVEMEEVLKCL